MNSTMNRLLMIGAFALAASLAACGGGGGGGPIGGPPATNPPTATPSNTSAQGTVIDDPSGTALAGEKVQLDPWTWVTPVTGTGPLFTPPPNVVPGPSPTPLLVTTTDTNGHFTITAPNGTYMLVIGSADPNDTTHPTIHDKVVLAGQTTLVAPTMPPIPGITPPPAETGGKYRITTVDPIQELPCLTAFDAQRVALGFPKPVVDEWLTENVRAAVAQSATAFDGQVAPTNTFGFLTTGTQTLTFGTQCAQMMVTTPGGAFDPTHTLVYATESPWFAGALNATGNPSIGKPPYGAALFPIDPRLFTDPNAVPWP